MPIPCLIEEGTVPMPDAGEVRPESAAICGCRKGGSPDAVHHRLRGRIVSENLRDFRESRRKVSDYLTTWTAGRDDFEIQPLISIDFVKLARILH